MSVWYFLNVDAVFVFYGKFQGFYWYEDDTEAWGSKQPPWACKAVYIGEFDEGT